MRALNFDQFATTQPMPDHHVYKAHLPEEAPLPYDEDPNNSTARMQPPHAYAKGALRPMRGKPYGRGIREQGE